MRVSEGSTVSHGPSCGMGGLLVRVTVRSQQVTWGGSEPRNGLMTGGFGLPKRCPARDTPAQAELGRGTLESISMEGENPFQPPQQSFYIVVTF
jgi:hypothetical protein